MSSVEGSQLICAPEDETSDAARLAGTLGGVVSAVAVTTTVVEALAEPTESVTPTEKTYVPAALGANDALAAVGLWIVAGGPEVLDHR